MEGPSIDQLLVEVGKSDTLLAVFRGTSESEVDGVPKFSPDTCRALVRHIACRSYARSLLELCHLLNIADACVTGRGGYLYFFWDSGPARPSAFRGYVRQAIDAGGFGRDGFTVASEGVTVDYPDGTFTVTFGRMPYLSAMLDFVVNAIGFEAVDEAVAAMTGAGPTRAAVSDAANGLARAVYEFLREHLPSAQNQRKFQRLTAFLKAELGEGFDISMVDDQTVLNFWLAESPKPSEDGTDFRTFQTVLRSFVHIIRALEDAQSQHDMRHTRSIGTDREAGEVDPDAVLGAIEHGGERHNPLDGLGQEPMSAVKFLNKQELGDLELVLETGAEALRLPISILRAIVFGRAQGRISQALRRKADRAELRELFRNAAEETYDQRRAVLENRLEHIRRVQLAAVHALIRSRRSEAVEAILTLWPALDLAPVAEMLKASGGATGNVVALHGDRITDRFIDLLEDPQQVGPELAEAIAEARRAYKGISRQGFGEQEADADLVIEAHARAVPLLDDIAKQVQAYLGRLDGVALPDGGWDGLCQADRDRFAAHFEVLYEGAMT